MTIPVEMPQKPTKITPNSSTATGSDWLTSPTAAKQPSAAIPMTGRYPLLEDLLQDQGMLLQGTYRTPKGLWELAADSPFRAIKEGCEYSCYRGFLLLDAAIWTLAPTYRVPVLVHISVGIQDISRAVITETLLKPLRHRLDAGECETLTDLVLRMQSSPEVASLVLAETKCALAMLMLMLVKRSLSDLRKKKVQDV